MTFRSIKLLQHAQDAPHCMLCRAANHGNVVGAHLPFGVEFKGIGHKPPDLVAYVCGDCHDRIDGRTQGGSRADRLFDFYLALYRSVVWLLETGRLTA